MHIIHIASELTPIAKVGGLGDVVHGLCKELIRLKHQVEILLPKYDCLDVSQLNDLKIESRGVDTIWSANVDGLPLILIESDYFKRGVIYGAEDDIDRFLYFSKAAMEYLLLSGKHPNVIHIHDWPTAAVALLYKESYLKLWTQKTGIVFTIHNMEHQGKCLPENLELIGLKGNDYLSVDKLQDSQISTDINLLKGGILYSDRVTTVSPTYEKEIQTPQRGCGLDSFVTKYNQKLKGILNGIDEEFWDPKQDRYLTHHYTTRDIDKNSFPSVLAAKEKNKHLLRSHCKLSQTKAPLVAAITRLVPQKSPELIKYALHRTLEKGGQFILLGSTCIPSIQKEFEQLQVELKNNKNAVILLNKDEALAHQIYAAADMLIIPSLFEPCGLTQLIALRYGTVPIACRTGGLADTVFDVDTSEKPTTQRNGFTFDFADTKGVDWALDRAIDCYQKNPQKWGSIMVNGMQQDYSWKHAVIDYLCLYQTWNLSQ